MDINNCDKYIINLKKDVGRKLNSKPIINLFKCDVWEAHDGNNVDENNIVSWSDIVKGTEAAKKTKIELLTYFLNKSKNKYLLILEDDCHLHIDLINNHIVTNYFNTGINKFLERTDPFMLYFGVSRHIKPKVSNILDLQFESFNSYFNGDVKKCSGAYGVIINRNIVKVILARATNETLYGKPFDLTCLGFVGEHYPEKTFITHPPIIVPNITQSNIRNSNKQELLWRNLKINKNKYYALTIGTLCVWIDDTKDIIGFYKKLNCIRPIVCVVFFSNEICDDIKFIDNLKKCTYTIYDSSKILNYLNCTKKIVRINTSYPLDYSCGDYLLNKFIDKS